MSIPVLPDEIAEALDDASPADDAATDEAVTAFIAEHVRASRPETLAGLTSALRKRFDDGESRHQSTVTVLPTAMKEARLGLYPAQEAIDAVTPMFLEAAAKPPMSGKQGAARNGAVARSEFNGMLAWAVGQALGADLDEVQARVDQKMPDIPWPTEPPDDDRHASEWTGQPDNDGERIDLHELAVLDELRKLRVRQDARRRLDAENRPALTLPPIRRLDELLAEPDTEEQYRVDQVAPADARIMLNAQWKAGKTTIVSNLTRALVDNEQFLGRFTVHTPAEQLVLIDDELSERTLRRWLREQNITNTTAVHVITLRGKVSTFNLLDDQVRAEWTERLGALGCDYLVLDCLRPVLDALGLDERSDAGEFLVAYDALLSDAGVRDSLIVQHMGHAGERARGDSRLQDWPDAIWSIVRETDNPDSPRFFSAYGRDVNVPEGRLSFDKATRRLTYAAGSRRDAATEAALVDVVKLLATTREPMSGRGIEDALSGTDHKRTAIRKAIKKSATDELVTETTGPKNAKLHTIAYPCAECGMPVASKRERHQACPPPDAQEDVLWL